ncbi:MAG TPA: hypothetical protein VFJ19_07390 [Nocardioidaceae bacterium]|nr:hypothetical protein [Nocardioidaceae bacterium]
MPRRRVAALAAFVVLALIVAGLLAWRAAHRRSDYESALAQLPRSTLRVTFTDWADVRAIAGGTSLGAASSHRAVSAFATRAYDRGLTSGSALHGSTYALMHRYGVSPLDAQWEALGQSRQGQVDVLRVDDDVDLSGIERGLRTLGYTPPSAGAGVGGTWVGSPDVVARIDASLTPIEQNLVVLPDRHLVLMSDDADYVTRAAGVVRGDRPSVADVAGVSSLAALAGQPASAVQWASTFACVDLSMASADPESQRVGDHLVAKSGGINPLSGLVMARSGVGKQRRIRVGMYFETSAEASANLQPRVDLASGPAPGQGGTFADRFRIVSGTADGQQVLLTLAPHRAGVLSDISTGPVLFATC